MTPVLLRGTSSNYVATMKCSAPKIARKDSSDIDWDTLDRAVAEKSTHEAARPPCRLPSPQLEECFLGIAV